MRSLILLLCALVFSTNNYAGEFLCFDIDFQGPDISLEVFVPEDGEESKISFLINGVESAIIDQSYKPQSSTYKNWNRLLGYFPSIGDGVEGYNVTLVLNPYLSTKLVKKAKFGFFQYRAAGPDGYYSVDYKCERQ